MDQNEYIMLLSLERICDISRESYDGISDDSLVRAPFFQKFCIFSCHFFYVDIFGVLVGFSYTLRRENFRHIAPRNHFFVRKSVAKGRGKLIHREWDLMRICPTLHRWEADTYGLTDLIILIREWSEWVHCIRIAQRIFSSLCLRFLHLGFDLLVNLRELHGDDDKLSSSLTSYRKRTLRIKISLRTHIFSDVARIWLTQTRINLPSKSR